MRLNAVAKIAIMAVLIAVATATTAYGQVGTGKLRNNYGSTLSKYAPVFVDSSANSSFTAVTTSRAGGFIGTVYDATIASGAYGNIIIAGNYSLVTITGTVTRGDYLVSSTTAGKAASGGTTNATGAFGVALETGTNTNIAAILIAPAVFSSSTSATLSTLTATGITVNAAASSVGETINTNATTPGDAFVIKDSSSNIFAAFSTGTNYGHMRLLGATGQSTGSGLDLTSDQGGTPKTGLIQLDSSGNLVFRNSTAGSLYFDYKTNAYWRSNAGAGGTTLTLDSSNNATFSGSVTAGQANVRSLYATSGSTLVINGNFSSALGSEWTPYGATLALASGAMRVTSHTGAAEYGCQTITGLTVGKRYKFSIDKVAGGTSVTAYTFVGSTGSASSDYYWNNTAAAGTVSGYFTATATSCTISLGSYNGGYWDFDNVSLIEMGDVSAAGTVFGTHVGAPYLAGAVTIPYGTMLTSGYGVSYLICSNATGVPIALYQDVDTWYLQKAGAAMITTNASGTTIAGSLVSSGVLQANSASGITTTQTGAFPLLNTGATTINFGGAATTMSIGAQTAASSYQIGAPGSAGAYSASMSLGGYGGPGTYTGGYWCSFQGITTAHAFLNQNATGVSGSPAVQYTHASVGSTAIELFSGSVNFTGLNGSVTAGSALATLASFSTTGGTLYGISAAYDANTSNSVTQPFKVQHVGDGNLNQGASIGFFVSSGAGAEMARIAAVNDIGAGASLRFYTRTSSTVTQSASLSSVGLFTANQFAIAALNSTPASAGATGTLGEIRWDANYMYVCTATNTWKRVAIATW